jgi:5-formyltetrahydrofolate cyclo-ligase
MLFKQEIRKQSITRRQTLTCVEVQEASLSVFCQVTTKLPAYDNANRIAGYWPCNGEINTMPLLEHSRKTGKEVYLPVIVNCPPLSLKFASYKPGLLLKLNRFNIPEPDIKGVHLDPNQLDLILVPLVYFDIYGTRIGMGGGFYDRSFSFLYNAAYSGKRPFLLGLGYEFQKAPVFLMRDDWDIPLNAVATENSIYIFS